MSNCICTSPDAFEKFVDLFIEVGGDMHELNGLVGTLLEFDVDDNQDLAFFITTRFLDWVVS